MTKKEILIIILSCAMALVGGIIFIKKNDSAPDAQAVPVSNSSCIQSGSRSPSPFDVAYCALANGKSIPQDEFLEGHERPSAMHPTLCGARHKSVCRVGGFMDGPSQIYPECIQFCHHPDTGTPVAAGTEYHYFVSPTGSLNKCQTARKISVCSQETGLFEPGVSENRHQVCSVINPNVGTIQYWSDPATWGGKLPQANEDVIIPADKNIIMDINPPPLKTLEINGTISFDNQDLTLEAQTFFIRGSLRVGSSKAPFKKMAIIKLKQIRLQGGKLYIFGQPIDRGQLSSLVLPKNYGRLPYENWGMGSYNNILILKDATPVLP